MRTVGAAKVPHPAGVASLAFKNGQVGVLLLDGEYSNDLCLSYNLAILTNHF